MKGALKWKLQKMKFIPRTRDYIALNWSKVNFAVASMRDTSSRVKLEEYPSDVKILKQYLKKFTGKKNLTIEETTSTHWLYVELKEFVDRTLVCDPYRNSIMKGSPKNDKIDAEKLCKLLRSGMLKEVFHTMDISYEIRKLSSNEDLYFNVKH